MGGGGGGGDHDYSNSVVHWRGKSQLPLHTDVKATTSQLHPLYKTTSPLHFFSVIISVILILYY